MKNLAKLIYMVPIVETNFFGDFEQVEDSKVLIIPTPYEYTTSYGKGTKNGPQGILNASTKLEFFDDELWSNPQTIGINTSNFVNCEFVNNKTKEPFVELEQAVRSAVISGCVPVVLGGEHSITYGSMKAIYDLYPEVSILYFGAQPHLKESSQNNKFSSFCTLRQIYNSMPELKISQVGIRSMSKEEIDWLEKDNANIEIFFAREKNSWTTADILSKLTKNVYISFNFDVLDPGIMPSVGTPEPSGFSFDQVIDILKNICTFKDIVGMDFVELSPISGLHAPDFLAAKLIYKTIGYTFARQLGVFEESESPLAVSEL